MVTYLASHNAVQLFNRTNGEELFKNPFQVRKLKQQYLKKIDQYIFEKGFNKIQGKAFEILSYLVYNTSVTGVQSISMGQIQAKIDCSRATVARAVKKFKEMGIFVVGYLNDNFKGHYVFALKLHENFEKVMGFVFGMWGKQEEQKGTNQQKEDTASGNVVKNNNDTSVDTSNETSSNSQNPCGSKAEGEENVPTIYTPFTLNTGDMLYTHLSPHQKEISDRIMLTDGVKEVYKRNADLIASMFPKKMSILELEVAEMVIKNKLTTVEPNDEKSVKNYVLQIWKNDVSSMKKKMKIHESIKFLAKQLSSANLGYQPPKKETGFVFYDWVNNG